MIPVTGKGILELLKPFLTIIILFLSTHSIFADKVKVTFLKGKAIYISPQGKKFKLKRGMVIKRDGLVKTAKKSLLRLTFSNGSTLNLGPKSSMAVSHENKERPQLIELIRGKVRGVVDPLAKPKDGYDHKMIIKTRSASLGIRGTDFVVTYNDKNHITSNITLKGEVDVYKKSDERIFDSLREEIDEKGRKVQFGQGDQLLAMEEDLRNYRTKRIPVGHFAGAFPSYEKAIDPVRLSDIQLQALGKNKKLNITEEHGNKKLLRNNITLGFIKNPNGSLIPQPRKNEKLAKNDYNKVVTSDGIRHGGHVDLETGIYIAPPEQSPIDPKSGKYLIPDELGGVDPDTGEYVPPKGVKLDPLYGFKYDETVPKDRNIKDNLEKLQNLTGPFYQQINQAIDIFKEITRLDLYSFANYQYVTNVLENYYGEFRKITDNPSMMWNLEGFAGFQLFHNKRWLIYPKGSLQWRYYERYRPEIRALNQYQGMLGGEVHYKHETFGRKSRLIFDLAFTTRYQNYRRRNLYDFYTEDTGLKITERLNLNTKNTLDLSYQVRSFHGYLDNDHGNIHNFFYNHEFELGETWSLLYGANWSWRDNKVDSNTYQIWAANLKFKWREILHRSDLTFGYTYQYHDTRFIGPFDHATYYKADILLHHNLGKLWKLNFLYEFDRMRTYGVPLGAEKRSFIRQSWGAGLTMYF